MAGQKEKIPLMAGPSERTVTTLFILTAVAVILGMTLQFGETARMVPLWVAALTLLLLVQLVRDLRAPSAAKRPGTSQGVSGISSGSEQPLPAQTSEEAKTANKGPLRARELQVMLWLALIAFLVHLFGFVFAAPLLILLAFKNWAGESWAVSIGAALGMQGLVYALIRLLMPGRLMEGIFWRWLGL
jgi:uncharacterized membrane protein